MGILATPRSRLLSIEFPDTRAIIDNRCGYSMKIPLGRNSGKSILEILHDFWPGSLEMQPGRQMEETGGCLQAEFWLGEKVRTWMRQAWPQSPGLCLNQVKAPNRMDRFDSPLLRGTSMCPTVHIFYSLGLFLRRFRFPKSSNQDYDILHGTSRRGT